MGAAGRTRGFAALFSEQGDLPRDAYYLERSVVTSTARNDNAFGRTRYDVYVYGEYIARYTEISILARILENSSK